MTEEDLNFDLSAKKKKKKKKTPFDPDAAEKEVEDRVSDALKVGCIRLGNTST